MSNNYLNHDVPGYSGNYDGGPSSGNLPEANNDENPKLTISSTEDTPDDDFYERVKADHIKYDMELYHSMLCNLEIESEEDKERQNEINARNFLKLCMDLDEKIDKTDKIEKSLDELQPPKTMAEIKKEPLDKLEEDLSFEEETEPLEYLSEIYLETAENNYNIYPTNPNANELETNRIFLQQCRQPGEIMYEINIQVVEIEPGVTLTEIKVEPLEEIEEGTEPFVYLPEVSSETTENSRHATNPGANDLDNEYINIIENSANVLRLHLKKSRKIEEVISTPTHVSSKIKKSRIM